MRVKVNIAHAGKNNFSSQNDRHPNHASEKRTVGTCFKDKKLKNKSRNYYGVCSW